MNEHLRALFERAGVRIHEFEGSDEALAELVTEEIQNLWIALVEISYARAGFYRNQANADSQAADREDALSATLLLLMKKEPRALQEKCKPPNKGSPSPFPAYVEGIFNNILRDQRRRRHEQTLFDSHGQSGRRRGPALRQRPEWLHADSDGTHQSEPLPKCSDIGLPPQLASGLARMPSAKRDLFRMRAVDGMEYSVIADVMNRDHPKRRAWTEGSTRTEFFRIRKRLGGI